MIALFTYYYMNRHGLSQSEALLKAFVPGIVGDLLVAFALIRSMM